MKPKHNGFQTTKQICLHSDYIQACCLHSLFHVKHIKQTPLLLHESSINEPHSALNSFYFCVTDRYLSCTARNHNMNILCQLSDSPCLITQQTCKVADFKCAEMQYITATIQHAHTHPQHCDLPTMHANAHASSLQVLQASWSHSGHIFLRPIT